MVLESLISVGFTVVLSEILISSESFLSGSKAITFTAVLSCYYFYLPPGTQTVIASFFSFLAGASVL